MPRPVLQIIAASTREGRKGIAVARWAQRQAETHGGFDVEPVDLATVGLPLLDEPHHPKLARYTHQHTRDWSATVSRADAFVFVTPEYNHSFPASLKNALDYLHGEWAHKPVGLVSYGGVSAGLRAATALRPVLASLRLFPATGAVSVPFFAEHLTEEGGFEPPAPVEAAGKAMLDELVRLTAVLGQLRPAG